VPTVYASIDEPAAGSSVGRGTVRVRGWAFDKEGPVESAHVAVDDCVATKVRLGDRRPDVREAFRSVPHAEISGFKGEVDLRAVTGDTARIALIVRLADGRWCEAAATDVVVGPAREREGRRRRAAFTIVQDERVMLPLWLEYYGRYFSGDDLFVLDHDSGDGCTAGLAGRCHVVPVHREASFDHHWLKSTVEAFQRFLLRSYDAVLFAEVDEFVIADPHEHAGLDAYIDALARPAARCQGFNVVHQPEEPALRFDSPLLAQRRYWHCSQYYSKRLLSRIPLRWSDGFHLEFDAPDEPPDPGLLLIHLHRADYETCLARHRAAATRDWNKADLAGGRAHNRIVEPSEFEEWFYGGPDLGGSREPIPERIRAVL
jgi:hypothetical protein